MSEQQPLPASDSSVKTRRLKMSRASTDTPGVGVPYLRLRGRWLKDAGFGIGQNVKVEIRERRLMIETTD